MSTWLDAWDRRYTDRVRLLVEILPVLAQEPNFALKGGTAINACWRVSRAGWMHLHAHFCGRLKRNNLILI